MSYGQNQPWGLMAVKTTTGAPWNGQTSQYLIPSGYAQNIFKGDLVVINSSGYIVNTFDVSATGATPSIGVFNGCSFQTDTSLNPIDPASPGRSYWPAGTITKGAVPATCDIIDDPSVIFNVQSGSTPVTQALIGQTAPILYQTIQPAGTLVAGNTNTGTSFLTLNAATAGTTATFALRILRLVNDSNNLLATTFNNAEVLIQNHAFVTRALGV